MASSDSMVIDFELSGVAYGHSSDVRDVVSVGSNMYASCSRDGTIRFWKRHADNTITEHKMVMGHQNVHKMGTRALAYVPPGHPIFKRIVSPLSSFRSPFLEDGALVSGGSDKMILVWDVMTWIGDEKEPLMHLVGHLENLTSLNVAANGDVLSGSSDMTAIVWRGNKTLYELKGHKAPVWAVIALQNGDIATGSGDRTIKIWRNGVCINTISEHGDSVRGLADVPGVGFVSASNDSTLKFFAYDGTFLQSLEGHEGFVYDVKVLSNGDIVSASEDGTIRVWRDFQCIQVIRHPIGVWRVGVSLDGDIISAGQDGLIRIFTRDPARKASEEILRQFSEEIANADKKKAVGDLDLSVLPGTEALLIPGSADGDTKMIKRDGKAFIYSWSLEKKQWVEMGEITDAKDTQKGSGGGGQGKQMAYGKYFDHVWDVEIGDGGPMKKIGYNAGDNPYLAAQDFISEHGLDQNFLEDIAKFIIRNVGESAAKAVGKTRATNNAAAPSPSAAAKPQSAPARQLPSSSSTHFPVLKPLIFDSANYDQISAKLKSTNDELVLANSLAALTLEEIALVEAIVKKLSQTRFYHSSTFSDKEFTAIEKTLNQWPLDKIPVVLDTLRLLALHPVGARRLVESKFILQALDRGTETGGHAANPVLAFRLIANAFQLESVRPLLSGLQSAVVQKALHVLPHSNANSKLAISSALLNFASLNLAKSAEEDAAVLANAVSTALEQNFATDADGEMSYILLAALGTSIYWCAVAKESAKKANAAFVASKLSASSNLKTKTAADDLLKYLN